MALKTMLDFENLIFDVYFTLNDVSIYEQELFHDIKLRGNSKLISYLINKRFYILILNDYDIAMAIVYNHEIYHNMLEEIENDINNIDFYDVRKLFIDTSGVYTPSLLDIKRIVVRSYYKKELDPIYDRAQESTIQESNETVVK